MKTIGLIGGMSWESSAEYYRLINEAVKRQLGGFHSARSVMISVDFADIEELQEADRWGEAAQHLIQAAQQLERGGAEFVLLCTNTMHRVAGDVEASIQIPFLHIADATGEKMRAQGLHTVGLLGTRYTMEQDFYKARLEERHHLEILVPDAVERDLVHKIIYEELVLGRVESSSREAYREAIARLTDRGAEAIILGCTEIGLLVDSGDSRVPLFDTTRIHAERAVDLALAG